MLVVDAGVRRETAVQVQLDAGVLRDVPVLHDHCDKMPKATKYPRQSSRPPQRYAHASMAQLQPRKAQRRCTDAELDLLSGDADHSDLACAPIPFRDAPKAS